MAKITATLTGDFQTIVEDLENIVLEGSFSASLEDTERFEQNGVSFYVGVFERYSYTGGNRVSLTVTLFGDNQTSKLCAVASGGSTGMFLKVNTFGEESFLNTITDCVEKYQV